MTQIAEMVPRETRLSRTVIELGPIPIYKSLLYEAALARASRAEGGGVRVCGAARASPTRAPQAETLEQRFGRLFESARSRASLLSTPR